MKIKQKYFPIIETEIETNYQKEINPYYHGGRINTLNFSSNKIFSNNTGKSKKIRLYSANNQSLKYKKQSSSNDKMILLKDINNNSNKASFHQINFLTAQCRPTSVNPKNQNSKNYSFHQKKQNNFGMGLRLNTELNYPSINRNMAYAQTNNLPLYRKRKIFYEEDNDLAEEYEKLRKIWKNVGVSDIYIDNFEAIVNNENNSKEEILSILKNEEKQMIKFKEDIIKVVAEIMKRENDIKKINEINQRYLEINTNIYLCPKKYIINNNFIEKEDNIDKEGDNDGINKRDMSIY